MHVCECAYISSSLRGARMAFSATCEITPNLWGEEADKLKLKRGIERQKTAPWFQYHVWRRGMCFAREEYLYERISRMQWPTSVLWIWWWLNSCHSKNWHKGRRLSKDAFQLLVVRAFVPKESNVRRKQAWRWSFPRDYSNYKNASTANRNKQ